MRQNKYILSIALPTYNNKEKLMDTVGSILSLKNNSVQLVISDNASSDGSSEELRKLKYDNLKVITNSENFGALFNMLKSLESCDGDYITYLTDNDQLNVKYLEEFINFLILNKPEVGHYSYLDNNMKVTKIQKTTAALVESYETKHPTGYIFRRLRFLEYVKTDMYWKRECVSLFPLEFICADIAQRNSYCICQGRLFQPNVSKTSRKIRSATTVHGKYAYYHPSSRTNLTISFLKHLFDLKDVDTIDNTCSNNNIHAWIISGDNWIL